ncbi:MAG: hypothetical protein PHZ19_00350 [Candidatus Thermoplasmatota archaeon]|nr:hypothetical protein [Candidatus Thermoplasmatota archaeon]
MTLNKSVGNMYGWVTHTWAPLAGECPHRCSYCWVRRGRLRNSPKYQGRPRLDPKAMNDNLGHDRVVFVAHTNDLFADGIDGYLIELILRKVSQHVNTYCFQTKNPVRYKEFANKLPKRLILGTTLETNRPISDGAPFPEERAAAMVAIKSAIPHAKIFVTIEPVIDFDLREFVEMIRTVGPDFVAVGADSQECGLPEPDRFKLFELLAELEKFTEIRQKENLGRLLA